MKRSRSVRKLTKPNSKGLFEFRHSQIGENYSSCKCDAVTINSQVKWILLSAQSDGMDIQRHRLRFTEDLHPSSSAVSQFTGSAHAQPGKQPQGKMCLIGCCSSWYALCTWTERWRQGARQQRSSGSGHSRCPNRSCRACVGIGMSELIFYSPNNSACNSVENSDSRVEEDANKTEWPRSSCVVHHEELSGCPGEPDIGEQSLSTSNMVMVPCHRSSGV